MNYFWNAVSSDGNSFDLFWLLAAATLKATVLLGFVALLCLLSPFLGGNRHLLWTLSRAPRYCCPSVCHGRVGSASFARTNFFLESDAANELREQLSDAIPCMKRECNRGWKSRPQK